MFDVFYTNQKPNLFAFEQPAASLADAAFKSRTEFFWLLDGNNNYSDFDFAFCAAPWESHQVHVWPTQWNQFGGTYFASKQNATAYEWHFRDEQVLATPTTAHWQTLVSSVEFDYSWAPHPMDPPYIYVFGNQWYGPEQMPTVEYITPEATERKYLYDPQARLLSNNSDCWVTTADGPITFDYSWVPDPHSPPYIYVFGNQHWEGERAATVEFRMEGATERKFVVDVKAELGLLDMFYLDKSNISSVERYEKLLKKYPNMQKVRFANTNIDTIKRCAAKAKTSKFWVVSSENIYDNFDFDWQPDPWQSHLTHVFGSQWDKWSDTFLVNKWEFDRHAAWAKTIAEFPNLNFVQTQHAKTANDNFDLFCIDHNNPNSSLVSLKSRYPQIKVTRFVDNYLDVMKRIINSTTSEYIWITSSGCDYRAFDFTWTPEPWQSEMIHCFGNEFLKRHDTFYINVAMFRDQMVDLEMLDWFNVICYHSDNLVTRVHTPMVYYDSDNLVQVIKDHKFESPYVCFSNRQHLLYDVEPCLWSQKDRTVMSGTPDNGVVAVPRDIKQYLKTQIYDYPYIDKRFNTSIGFGFGMPLDIIYISNGEPDADKYWEKLKQLVPNPKRSDGVTGRTAAYQAAANMSTTHWFYAVFAKLDVNPTFDWSWRPDLFQEPKHYIFNSLNPLNGLEYGHQGMIAYNKKLVLENNNPGLDFTLSQAHESVPMLSGVARFNQDPWMTWRTAFREVIKLQQFESVQPTIEGASRLHTWCTVADGDYAEWCLRGAHDAVEYFKSTNGDHSKLNFSFEWSWLKNYFNEKSY